MTDLSPAAPQVSVIIAAYNAEATIERCLLSLSRQTISQDKIEVILVDDASTDGTSGAAQEHGAAIRNFKYVRQARNAKAGEARNLGVDLSSGKYLTFLDADDFLRLDALETALFQIGDADCLVFQHVFCRFDEDYRAHVSNRVAGEDLKLAALTGKIGWWPFGFVVRSEVVKSNHIRFPSGVYFEDIDFIIDTFSRVEKAKVIKSELYYYVQSSASIVGHISSEKLEHSVGAMLRIRRRLLERGVGRVYFEAFEAAASRWLRSQGRRIAAQYDGAERDRLLSDFSMLIGREFAGSSIGVKFPKRWPPLKAKPTPRGYHRWTGEFDKPLSGKVVFYCEVDYHVRAAAAICRLLSSRSIPAVIVDASRSKSFTTSRPLSDKERVEFADVEILQIDVSERLPYSASAAALVVQNDLTYTRDIIFENFGIGVPTIGLYEGINDDLNVDRSAPRRPYRSVDYLLLPGEFQRKFYADRETAVTGLSSIRRMWSLPFAGGGLTRAIINVNFTYGVLEHRRDEYVRTAVAGCAEAGIPYVISQHPADKADLSAFNVSTKSMYELLREGGVLVSRFSTTLLEGMALGRAVIYHNPIDERVEKFQEPLGAYQVTRSKSELVAALRAELATGLETDRRARATRFLDHHCNVTSAVSPEDAAAEFISSVLARGRVPPIFKTDAPKSAGPEPTASRLLPVSIVVPAYNAEGKLEAVLSSIARRTMPEFECIVVDDGSTDGTRAIAKRFQRADARFRLITHRAHAGVSASRNSGLRAARGEYVAFLDAHDVTQPNCLEKRLGANRNGVTNDQLGSNQPMIRRDVLRDAGGFDESSTEPPGIPTRSPVLTEPDTGAIYFLPHSGYHVWTIDLVAPALRAHGIPFVVVDISTHSGDGGLRQKLAELAPSSISYSRFVLERRRPGLVVVFNDWDRATRPIIAAARVAGIPTAAIVEGIQDYNDVDTGRTRNAYKMADAIILPGAFDRRYFPDGSRQRVYVAGIPRVRHLRENPRPAIDTGTPIALINANFSYNVLAQHRDEWLRSAVAAVRAAGLQPVISRHPGDAGREHADLVTDADFYTALAKSVVTVQRFASGILEALAIGRGVVYFNPHGEKVDKFSDPLGAYKIAMTQADLTLALQDWPQLAAMASEHGPSFLDLHAGPISARTDEAIVDALRAERTVSTDEKAMEIFHTLLGHLDIATEALTDRKRHFLAVDQSSLEQIFARLKEAATAVGPVVRGPASARLAPRPIWFLRNTLRRLYGREKARNGWLRRWFRGLRRPP
jgi:glycosyltransferase involved in cell wall biosynthesis